ncbi:MAG TPA: hypothetical protein VFC44_03645 [Candidatus Saccharimonadales bacterium]|nr:hypothetical protein [Candidatus Saccharimonadales bacterium]
MQLVETPDSRLSGQFEASTIQADGKIQYENTSVAGAADGSNVSLIIPLGPLGSGVEFSGVLSWRGLTLTGGLSGGRSSTFALRRGDLHEYQAALVALNKRSVTLLAALKKAEENAAIAAQKAAIASAAAAMREKALQDQQNFARYVGDLCDKMQKFEITGSVTLQKFPTISAKYRTITAKMDGYLQRDRKLAGNSRASYSRSQISFAMGNGIFATKQVHFDVQSLQGSFVNDVEPQMQSVENAMRICGNTNVPVPVVTPACEHLQILYPAYSKAYHDVATGLADLENTYNTELQKQLGLKSEADRIN